MKKSIRRIATMRDGIDKVLESATSEHSDKIFYFRRIGKNSASATKLFCDRLGHYDLVATIDLTNY